MGIEHSRLGLISEDPRERFRQKKPCLNCPFRSDETRIKFRCRERAAELEEVAYRNGFPCHESALLDDAKFAGEDDRETGYTFGPRTQHCAGYTAMKLREQDGAWPGIGNDDEFFEYLEDTVPFLDLPVFESTEAFLEANTTGKEDDS